MITAERHRAIVVAFQPISGVTEDCWIFRVGVSAILVISNAVFSFVIVVSVGSKVIDWFLTGSSLITRQNYSVDQLATWRFLWVHLTISIMWLRIRPLVQKIID